MNAQDANVMLEEIRARVHDMLDDVNVMSLRLAVETDDGNSTLALEGESDFLDFFAYDDANGFDWIDARGVLLEDGNSANLQQALEKLLEYAERCDVCVSGGFKPVVKRGETLESMLVEHDLRMQDCR